MLSKTILLIGSTGKGKSALANVLVNEVNEDGRFEDFQEIFKESGASVSSTKEIQKEEFVENGINYAVIDTVGIGDTKLKKEEVLDKIAKAVYLTREGIGQVLFIIDGRFDEKEMANYVLLRTIIFDNEVVNHTTIIRTRFENFNNSEKCWEDIDSMIKGGGKLARIIKSCQKRVIHMNNPSLDLLPDDAESEEERKKAEEKVTNEIETRKETRGISRKLLLEHLKKVCQKEPYKPSKLKKLSNEISNYMESKIMLEEELRKLGISAYELPPEIVNKEQEKVFAENMYIEKESLKGTLELIEDNKLKIGQRITHLEDKKVKLKKEITANEKFIRQKVLKHIFDNYETISNELGGDILLDSIFEDNNNWKIISQVFADKKLILEWKSNEFDYHEVQEWVTTLGNRFSLKRDAGFCAWLRDIRQLTAEEIKVLGYPQGIEQLRQRYAQWLEQETNLLVQHNQQLKNFWVIIHPDFADKYNNQTYQQIWEGNGITKEEAEKWVAIGFNPYKKVGNTAYLCLPQDWKNLNLTLADAKKWIEIGLETTEYDLSNYLRRKEYELMTIRNNLENLREEYKEWRKSLSAQEYLDFFYPLEKRNEVTRINIIQKNLTGSLNLTGFSKLKELDCSCNDLTYLDISQCKELTELYCYNNQLANDSLLLPKRGGELVILFAHNNHFTDLTPFNELVSCEILYLESNPWTNNSLKPLQNLEKLKELGIDSEQFADWKYLLENLERLYCSGSLVEELKDYQTEDSYFFDSSGFSYKYQSWRKDNQESIQQIESLPK